VKGASCSTSERQFENAFTAKAAKDFTAEIAEKGRGGRGEERSNPQGNQSHAG
jgi:hypothetical protein